MEQVEIACRCKECLHFEETSSGVGYCYYWNYEQGENPNMTAIEDFCSNGEKK